MSEEERPPSDGEHEQLSPPARQWAALASFDATRGLRDAIANYKSPLTDAIANYKSPLTDVIANFDATRGLAAAVANTELYSRNLANFDATSGLREALADYDAAGKLARSSVIFGGLDNPKLTRLTNDIFASIASIKDTAALHASIDVSGISKIASQVITNIGVDTTTSALQQPSFNETVYDTSNILARINEPDALDTLIGIATNISSIPEVADAVDDSEIPDLWTRLSLRGPLSAEAAAKIVTTVLVSALMVAVFAYSPQLLLDAATWIGVLGLACKFVLFVGSKFRP